MENDLMLKAKSAKSAEGLASLAASQGITLNADQAKSYYARLHASGEIADEELDDVAGGGCGNAKLASKRAPKMKCPYCGFASVQVFFGNNELPVDFPTFYKCNFCKTMFPEESA